MPGQRVVLPFSELWRQGAAPCSPLPAGRDSRSGGGLKPLCPHPPPCQHPEPLARCPSLGCSRLPTQISPRCAVPCRPTAPQTELLYRGRAAAASRPALLRLQGRMAAGATQPPALAPVLPAPSSNSRPCVGSWELLLARLSTSPQPSEQPTSGTENPAAGRQEAGGSASGSRLLHSTSQAGTRSLA